MSEEAEIEIIKRQQKALDEWAKLCEPLLHLKSYDRRDVNLAIKHLRKSAGEYVQSQSEFDEISALIARLEG